MQLTLPNPRHPETLNRYADCLIGRDDGWKAKAGGLFGVYPVAQATGY
jgi:hypothetical protein